MSKRILCINPGSTSTRIAVYQGNQQEFTANVTHSNEILESYGGVQGQLEYLSLIHISEPTRR